MNLELGEVVEMEEDEPEIEISRSELAEGLEVKGTLFSRSLAIGPMESSLTPMQAT